jgi:hypothetical protein
VNTSFPKGEAFAEWLVNVGASSSQGTVPVTEIHQHASAAVAPAVGWLGATGHNGGASLLHYTFNTPVGTPPDKQCGRVVYSGFHTSAWERSRTVDLFPGSCVPTGPPTPMTPNEKILEFMFFDLNSCLLPDTGQPAPPTIQ